MSKSNGDLSRFSKWLTKNVLPQHENTVVNLLVEDFVHIKDDESGEFKSVYPGSALRSFNKVVSRAKLREVLLKDYIRDDFELRQLTREALVDILKRSVQSKYAGNLYLEKGAHRQGIYVQRFRMPRKAVETVAA